MAEIPSEDSGSGLSTMPGPPPRPITARGRRRSWGEARVRAWWMAGGVMLLLAMVYSAQRAIGLWRDVDLVRRGVRVEALLLEADGDPSKNKVHLPEQRAVFKLRFVAPDGSTHTIVDRLRAQRRAMAVGESIPLFVDPADPGRWTDRQRIAWGEEMLVGLGLAAAGMAMLAVAAVKRIGILKTWRNGEVIAVIVVERRIAALAPRSWSMRFVIQDTRDKRIYSTLVPARFNICPGERVWMVALPGRADRAIAGGLYA